MVHGHPETYDDAVLEAGNRTAKNGKKILFWGGTDEEGATYEQEYATGKRDAEGNPIMRKVTKKANASIVVSHLENTHIAQHFHQQRGGGVESEKVLMSKEVKSEQYNKQCMATATSLGNLDAKMSEAEADDTIMGETADDADNADMADGGDVEMAEEGDGVTAAAAAAAAASAEPVKWTVTMLKEALKAKGLKVTGSKADLEARLARGHN